MKILYVMAIIAFLCSCSSTDKDNYVERPAEELFNSGMSNFKTNKFDLAVADFDELERQHPYSRLVPVAMIRSAYSSYRAEKYDDAILTLDRFIAIYPGNKYAPYAFYLKAMCYYERIVDVSREQKMTDLSREAFRELIIRYPNSVYARDARLKMDFTRSHLAGKEMEIGRYYLFRNNYVAALKHFNVVINSYQETSHIVEALYRTVEVYLTIGLDDEALKMASILGHNYQHSVWYKRAFELMNERKEELKNKENKDKALIKPEDVEKLPEVSDKDIKDELLTNPDNMEENELLNEKSEDKGE